MLLENAENFKLSFKEINHTAFGIIFNGIRCITFSRLFRHIKGNFLCFPNLIQNIPNVVKNCKRKNRLIVLDADTEFSCVRNFANKYSSSIKIISIVMASLF